MSAQHFDHFTHFEGFPDPSGDPVDHLFRNAARNAADQDHGDPWTDLLQAVEGASDIAGER